jgi:hypothetical protein
MVGAAQGADALAFLRTTVESQKLTADKPEDVARCVELIKQFGLKKIKKKTIKIFFNICLLQGLVREHIPTELLNSDKVWEALLEKMPMTALIRNLSKLSSLGLITGEKKVINIIIKLKLK